MMSDGVVSIGEGKSGSEASPTHKRRGSNFGLGVTSAAPAPGTRAKRSPQGSVTGGSSTKGSERDEMEEVSNEEGVSLVACLHSTAITLQHYAAWARLAQD